MVNEGTEINPTVSESVCRSLNKSLQKSYAECKLKYWPPSISFNDFSQLWYSVLSYSVFSPYFHTEDQKYPVSQR